MPSKKHPDPDFIGPHCYALGIKISNLGMHSAKHLNITNGVVIELNRYAKHVNIEDRSVLSSWLSALGFPSKDNTLLLQSINALCLRREYLRRRKKQDEIESLEGTDFDIETWSQPVDAQTQISAPSPVHEAETISAGSKRSSPFKVNNALTHEISVKKKVMASLEDQVCALKTEICEKRKETGHYGPFNVDRRDARHKQTRAERDEGKSNIIKLTAENDCLRQQKKILEDQLTEIKKNYHRKQKLVAYYQSHEGGTSQCTCARMRKELTTMALDKEALEDELKEARKERIVVTKDGNGAFTEDVRMCVLELLALEVATGKISNVIQVVSKYLFSHTIPESELPKKRTCQKIADEGHFIAKSYVGERIQESKAWGLHKDGTSRKKVKILDTAVCLEDGETLSLGFSTVASETGQAIADDSIRKLEEIHADNSQTLEKMVYTMSDRAANEKKSNTVFSQWREEKTSDSDGPPKLQHFYCMAHVLLGFQTECVKQLKEVQTTLSENGLLGRDCHPGFKRYRTSEAAPRLCVSASNAFAPVGDFMGVRDIWDAYCMRKNISSHIKNYKDNRFNGLFHTCAAITYHRHHFLEILSNLNNPNKKLGALQKDLEDDNLMVIARGLGIVYLKITSPFWTLVTSKLSYLQIQPVIQQLHADLEALTHSPKSITTTTLASLQEYTSDSSLSSIIPPVQEIDSSLELVLQTLLTSFITLMNRQLNTYITDTASPEDVKLSAFAPATNLICERNFGDLDSSQHRRPSATMHHHTTVHLLKRSRDKLSKWMHSMTPDHRLSLFKEARKKAPILRKQHQQCFKEELAKSLNKIKGCGAKRRPEEDEQEEEDTDDEETSDSPEFEIEPGCWVAVAYPEGWYPGIVEGIVGDDHDMFDINFGHWCPNKKDIKWPDGRDRHPVHRHFVIHTPLDIDTLNGRTWIIKDLDNLTSVFQKFKDKHF